MKMSDHEFMLIDRDYSQQRRNRFLFRVVVIGFASILIFVFIALIISSNSPTLTRPKFVTKCSTSYSFDYSVFTIRWSPTICNNSTNQNFKNQCPKHDTNKWFIHGLWPTYSNHSWPQFCCFDRKFDVKNLDPIVTDLLSYWPNLMPNATSDSLWKHEWEKHGTCTKTKQLNYFNNTLQLYKRFPISQWLQESNIIPTNNNIYHLDEFNDVLNSKLGHKVQLKCIKNSDGKSFLDEIHICIDHNLTNDAIDCPEEHECKKLFYYPKE